MSLNDSDESEFEDTELDIHESPSHNYSLIFCTDDIRNSVMYDNPATALQLKVNKIFSSINKDF